MFPQNYFGPIGTYSLSSSGGVGSYARPISTNGSPITPDGFRVEDGCGKPISGALIEVYDASDTSFIRMLGNTGTLSDGRWGPISLPSGSYTLVVKAPPDQSVTVPFVIP